MLFSGFTMIPLRSGATVARDLRAPPSVLNSSVQAPQSARAQVHGALQDLCVPEAVGLARKLESPARCSSSGAMQGLTVDAEQERATRCTIAEITAALRKRPAAHRSTTWKSVTIKRGKARRRGDRIKFSGKTGFYCDQRVRRGCSTGPSRSCPASVRGFLLTRRLVGSDQSATLG